MSNVHHVQILPSLLTDERFEKYFYPILLNLRLNITLRSQSDYRNISSFPIMLELSVFVI